MNISLGSLLVLTVIISCHADDDFLNPLPKGKTREQTLKRNGGAAFYGFRKTRCAATRNESNKLEGGEDPIVQLPKGKIRGHVLKSEDGKPYYAFQEIPYAAPPTGSNRFQLPKEPQAWTGILNTTRNTVICYQGFTKYPNLKESEDCLYVNVYTPVVPGTSEQLPVLVWIHGGSFTGESGNFEYFGPKYIMDQGIVVVTFNYRLGPFGFLSTLDDVIPSNIALKDQQFALEWVQENIKFFGGNKSHVTLAGQSAGAMAIGLHLLGSWKNDKVLFHAAIQQSGSPLFVSKGNNYREAAFNVGLTLNPTFVSKSSKDLLMVLQNATAKEILEASNGKTSSWPIVEESGDFRYKINDNLETGNFKKVPLLIGYNSEEWILIASFLPLEALAAGYDKDPSQITGDNSNIPAIKKTIVGNLLRKIYTNTSFQDNLCAVVRFSSDAIYTTPIIKQATLQSKKADVYLYEFAYKGELGFLKNIRVPPGCEKVSHTEELKYMWDDKSNSDLSKFPAADRLMLHRFVKLWTNFVKYHNPTPAKDPFLENVIWPKVDPNQPENIQYLNMNATLEVRTNPRYYQKVIKVIGPYISS